MTPISDSEPVRTLPLPLCDAVARYLIHIRGKGLSGATVESYRGTLEVISRLLGPDTPAPLLSCTDLDRAFILLTEPSVPGADSGTRSQVTLNRYRSIVRSFFAWAVEAGLIPSSPARLLRAARVDSAATSPMTDAEVSRFLLAIRCSADKLRLRDEALFSLYAMTGLRRSEVVLMRWADYDAAAGILNVRHGKGGRKRSVPVAPVLAGIMDSLRLLPGTIASGRLFPGRANRPCLSQRQVQSRFVHWKRISGLRSCLTLHSFRSGFATAIYQRSRDIVLVSGALGHSQLQSTLRYIQQPSNTLLRLVAARADSLRAALR